MLTCEYDNSSEFACPKLKLYREGLGIQICVMVRGGSSFRDAYIYIFFVNEGIFV